MSRIIEEEDAAEEVAGSVEMVVEIKAEATIPKKNINRVSKIGVVEDEVAAEEAIRVEQMSSVTTAESTGTTRKNVGTRKR